MKSVKNLLLIVLLLAGSVSLFLAGCNKDDNTETPSGTITDADGNIYHTVTINNQVWMVENLKTTRYNDSTEIPLVTDNSEWSTLTSPGYSWYNNDPVSNSTSYGALYNWYAVNTGKLCPKGWRIPSEAEWESLISFLGGDSVAGGALKESGTAHWASPNTGASNSSGFTALPGGSHYSNGLFYYQGKYGWYWSSTELTADEAWHIYVNYNSSAVVGKGGAKKIGFSVRCIKN